MTGNWRYDANDAGPSILTEGQLHALKKKCLMQLYIILKEIETYFRVYFSFLTVQNVFKNKNMC